MVNVGALPLALLLGACGATVGCGAASSSKRDGATEGGHGATNEGDVGVDSGDGATNQGDGGADRGGDGPAASACGRAPPCGGDPTGTWKMVAMCIVDPSFLGIDTSPICPAASLDSSQ